jgi:hypothetical protein
MHRTTEESNPPLTAMATARSAKPPFHGLNQQLAQPICVPA